jgi:small subunit ribosomal protein S16
MVRIRLRRTGKRHQPSYRVVVADLESPRDGRFIENIGFYNPRNDPPTIEIDVERARYWLSVGAQPSDAAARLLRKVGAMAGGEAAKEAVAVEAVAEAAVSEEEAFEETVVEETVAEAAVSEEETLEETVVEETVVEEEQEAAAEGETAEQASAAVTEAPPAVEEEGTEAEVE